jgi:hypothetical protein
MATSNLPQPLLDSLQRAILAMSQLDPMREALDALGRAAAEQALSINRSVEEQQRRLGRQWAERINQTLAASLPSWQADINSAVEALGRTAAQQLRDLQRLEVTFDTTGLSRMLQDVEAWRALDAEQQTATAQALDDAYHSADTAHPDDVPDDLITGLEESARDFASAQGGLLTPERQRQLFVYFCGLVVLLALMQASFTSETADAVIEKTITLAPAAILTMAAAGTAWDRIMPRRPEDEEDSEDQTGNDRD